MSLLLTLLSWTPALAPAPVQEPAEFVVRAAKVFTATEAGVLNHGAVHVRDGKIVAVGRASELVVPHGVPVIDAGENWLAPGLIEPHSHAAGVRSDINDMVYLTNPELRTDDIVNLDHGFMRDALAGGVTTQLLIPGSGTNMGGFGTLTKTAGDNVDDALVRSPGSLKVAQAGNPESYSFGVRRAMMNWNTRHSLKTGLQWAADYEAGKVPFDPAWEGFLGLRDGSVPVSVHTQIYQVVLMTITMQKEELGLEAFIDHGTFDGYKTAHLAAAAGVPVMNGPRQFYFDRSTSRIQGCTAGWAEAVPEGLILGYNTDSPGVPAEELTFQAAMGVRLGHDDHKAALEGITSNAAIALKCTDLCGSLAPGLEADLVIWNGYPLDPRSGVERTWIRGELVYDAERDGRRF